MDHYIFSLSRGSSCGSVILVRHCVVVPTWKPRCAGNIEWNISSVQPESRDCCCNFVDGDDCLWCSCKRHGGDEFTSRRPNLTLAARCGGSLKLMQLGPGHHNFKCSKITLIIDKMAHVGVSHCDCCFFSSKLKWLIHWQRQMDSYYLFLLGNSHSFRSSQKRFQHTAAFKVTLILI